MQTMYREQANLLEQTSKALLAPQFPEAIDVDNDGSDYDYDETNRISSINEINHSQETEDTEIPMNPELEAENIFHIFNDQNGEFEEKDIYLMMLMLQVRHNMSNAALEDWARLLNLLLKKKINVSYKTILKKSGTFSPKIEKFFYTKCGISQPVTNLQSYVQCNIQDCTTCIDVFGNRERIYPAQEMTYQHRFFCSVSIKSWLTYLLPHVYQKLSFGNNDPKEMSDLKDGSEYQRLKAHSSQIKQDNNDPFSKAITLSFGYDGASYTSDNSKSLWPIVMFINELPEEIRLKTGYPLTMHSGEKKPGIMFQAVISELLIYDTVPLEVEIKGVIEKFYVRLLLTIADAPARCDVMLCKQHNSLFGCPHCYFMTIYLENAVRYPMITDFVPRTDTEWRNFMDMANEDDPDQTY